LIPGRKIPGRKIPGRKIPGRKIPGRKLSHIERNRSCASMLCVEGYLAAYEQRRSAVKNA
jgi:hypothetical protein